MRKLTFRGGVHPPTKKLSAQQPIRNLPHPPRVIIPLSQHTGAPCNPLVAVGDTVKTGQKIGDHSAFISAPVHASLSGKVISIDDHLHPVLGREAPAVVIESDGRDEWQEVTPLPRDYLSLTPNEIRQLIREAGVVGLGGAAFPTHVKLTPPEDKKIEMVILNGCECEPYLTADFRLMLEKSQEIIEGLKITMRVLGVEKAFIGVEDNKLEAINTLQTALGSDSSIKVVKLKTKYPQGSEKHLIKAITGREVPSGGLPLDVGIVVNNIGTALAIFETVTKRRPLIERVITVSGEGVKEPQNFRVLIGTPFSFVVEAAGGIVGNPGKIIMGGPMMGIVQSSLEVPVIKGTTAILIFPRENVWAGEAADCIRCGRCIEICPMGLMPNFISIYVEKNRIEKLENYHALDCIECGSCAYICATRRPLVQHIKYAKDEISRRKKKERESVR